MISFSKLGNYGRLGNQLFQYAYIRSMAMRLGTSFYCPRWDGDDIFDLSDELERSQTMGGMDARYIQSPEAGFSPAAMEIGDGTDVEGFFQSERYFLSRQLVLDWFRFKRELIDSIHPDQTASAANSISFSLRIDGDYANTREYFPLYSPGFYEAAYRRCGGDGPILVFSDRPDMAEAYFRGFRNRDVRFVRDLSGPQQLHLMSLCRANVITNSTFAWWGAWLNQRADRVVIAPHAWCRPGVSNQIRDILCDDWIKVRSTVPVWDHFQLWRIRHPLSTVRRVMSRVRAPG